MSSSPVGDRHASVRFCVVVGVCLCEPSAASAELARSRSGTEVRWQRQSIALELVESGPRSQISTQELREALVSGVAAWNRATSRCRVPRLEVEQRHREQAWFKQDGRSEVLVVDRSDCRRNEHPSLLCSNPDVAAKTHLYPRQASGSPTDGVLDEADLELSGAHYSWSLDGTNGATGNLRRTLHHELGHVLGLGHPCVERPNGRAGTAPEAGRCDSQEMVRRLMHPVAALAASPASLVPDELDVEELCRIYGRKSFFFREGYSDHRSIGGLALAAFLAVVSSLFWWARKRTRPSDARSERSDDED